MMYSIIQHFKNPLRQTKPQFWNAKLRKYEAIFDLATHSFEEDKLDKIKCPTSAVIVSEVYRHQGAKCTDSTYRRRNPGLEHLVVVKCDKEWVVLGRLNHRAAISKTIVLSSEWSVASLVELIASGRILIDPLVKCRHCWQLADKSRYLESLMLGLPVSQIVLAASLVEKSQYTVVDGNQRLLCIAEFYGVATTDAAADNNNFALAKLDYRTELNGLNHQGIKADINFGSAAYDLDKALVRTVRLQHCSQVILDNLTKRLNK